MGRFLLDSHIIIWHLRGREEVTAMLRDLQRFGVPGCSALSVLEVQLGVKRGEEEKTNYFFEHLTVFDVDRGVASKAAHLIRGHKGKGVTLDIPDAVIASTCILHDLILVTLNKKHYPIKELEFYPVTIKP